VQSFKDLSSARSLRVPAADPVLKTAVGETPRGFESAGADAASKGESRRLQPLQMEGEEPHQPDRRVHRKNTRLDSLNVTSMPAWTSNVDSRYLSGGWLNAFVIRTGTRMVMNRPTACSRSPPNVRPRA
jgi:hypothetical protein